LAIGIIQTGISLFTEALILSLVIDVEHIPTNVKKKNCRYNAANYIDNETHHERVRHHKRTDKVPKGIEDH
jgi:hypothetical protein